MIAAAVSILVLVVFTILSTLATVLMARFFLGRLSADVRIVVAGLGGPGFVITPFLLYMIVSEGLGDPITLVTLVVMAIGFVVVGWPTSFFATRKLDRLVACDPGVFE